MKATRVIRMATVLICLSFCVFGCVHYPGPGSGYTKDDLGKIAKGKTTSSELMNILGTPYSKTPTTDGGEQWSYPRSDNCDQIDMIVPVPGGAIGHVRTTQQKQCLTVLLNKEGVVVDFTFEEPPNKK